MAEQSFVPAPPKVKVRKAPRKILRTTREVKDIVDRPDLENLSMQNKLRELGLAGPQSGMSTQIFRDEVANLARRNPTSTLGISPKFLLHALDSGQIEDACEEVYGLDTTKNKINIDLELCEIAIDEAAMTLLKASAAGAKIIFASSRPGATLPMMSGLANLAEEFGAVILESFTNTATAIVDGRSGRNLSWSGKVATVCEPATMSLLGTNDIKISDDLFFHLPRPDLVVADHVFAAGAIARDYPTISFVGLESLAVAVASTNERNALAVPINLSKPSSHYEIINEYFEDFFEAQS